MWYKGEKPYPCIQYILVEWQYIYIYIYIYIIYTYKDSTEWMSDYCNLCKKILSQKKKINEFRILQY